MENNEMKKTMGVMTAMSIVVGCVIGAAYSLSLMLSIRQQAEHLVWDCCPGSSEE